MNEFDSSNKKLLREMSFKEKLQYFKDYYLLRTAVIAAAVCFAVYLIHSLLQPAPVPVLRVAAFDTIEYSEEMDRLIADLRDEFDANGERDELYIATNYVSSNQNDLARLGVMATANELDAIIAPRSVFCEFASYGYFLPLDDYLSEEELAGLSDLIVETEGMAVSDDPAVPEESLYGQGEVLAYGVSLAESERWNGLVYGSDGDYVIGIADGAARADNAARFIRFLCAPSSR